MSGYVPNPETEQPETTSSEAPPPSDQLPGEPRFDSESSEPRPDEPALAAAPPSENWRAQRAAIREQDFIGRINDLTAQIERYPNTPVNFIIRGEVYLAHGQADAASIDFQRALDLAESRVDTLPWGYVNAGLIDRAREGLVEANDRLQAARA